MNEVYLVGVGITPLGKHCSQKIEEDFMGSPHNVEWACPNPSVFLWPFPQCDRHSLPTGSGWRGTILETSARAEFVDTPDREVANDDR
jgi:hypothetical protein